MVTAQGGKGINRNIVECKSVTYEKEYEENMELIETLWNVNSVGSSGTVSFRSRINRNIVECK